MILIGRKRRINFPAKGFLHGHWTVHRLAAGIVHLGSAYKVLNGVIGQISLHSYIRDFLTQNTHHIVGKLAVDILLGTSFADKNILVILRQSKKVVPINSRPTTIPASKTTDWDVELSTVDVFKETPARMSATKTRNELRKAKQICLKKKGFRTVRIVFKETGLIYSEPTENVIRQGQLMEAKCIMEVRPSVLFDLLVPNVANIPVFVPKNMVFFTSSDSMVSIFDLEQIEKERCHTPTIIQATPRPPVQMDVRATTLYTNQVWKDTANTPPEFVSVLIRFINMLKQFQEI